MRGSGRLDFSRGVEPSFLRATGAVDSNESTLDSGPFARDSSRRHVQKVKMQTNGSSVDLAPIGVRPSTVDASDRSEIDACDWLAIAPPPARSPPSSLAPPPCPF
eukprot:217284-Prorocentrum_minimum.AAC.1